MSWWNDTFGGGDAPSDPPSGSWWDSTVSPAFDATYGAVTGATEEVAGFVRSASDTPGVWRRIPSPAGAASDALAAAPGALAQVQSSAVALRRRDALTALLVLGLGVGLAVLLIRRAQR